MQKLINLKTLDGTYPRFIYRRFQVSHFWEYFSEKIDFGFDYLFHRLRVKYPSTVPVPNDGSIGVFVPLAAHVLGDMIYTTLGDLTFPVFVCTVPGNSGAAAPIWPMQEGVTIVDGGVTWTAYDRNKVGLASPQINVEVFDVANDFTRQLSPVPVDLFCTSGSQECFFRPSPQPVDADGFNVNYTANSPYLSLQLNYFYKRGETFFMKISGQNQTAFHFNPFNGVTSAITPTWTPAFVDLLVEGYYVPEKTLALWKERKIV